MTARVYCAILLCLSGYLSFTEAAPGLNVAVKPGVCPRRRYEAAMCAVMRFKWMCDHDSDCAKNEKCCHNGCVLECMAPAVTVKPGVCPRRRYEPAMCATMRFAWMCNNDSDCAKNEKCCHNGCVLDCMAPI